MFVLWLLAALTVNAQSSFLTESDFARIDRMAASERWAASAKSAILDGAANFRQSHLAAYGLSELAIPNEGGQWPLWYVCPVHGVRLQFRAPDVHQCTVDNRRWTSWPYDQVILGRRHQDLANAARDAALAFRFTGERRHADLAKWILLGYADRYPGYAIKDVNNRVTRTGARASAQTLDEAVWLIPLAWAYDLLSGSDVLSSTEREHVEKNLLRAAVETIERYEAGISNWQSWHNAAIGAVGFAVKDAAMWGRAIDGRSGLRFQLKNSVLGEGFWYEGAWSYHFYALDALVQLAEMAARAGVDVYSDNALRGLFRVPPMLMFADGSLPAFNDSNTAAISAYARLYEIAFARYDDPLFAAVAAKQSRGRDALLFGAERLPASTLDALASAVFPESGFAVLRAPSSDHAVTMKFGPHGGGHGHNDKLGFISYAPGGILGVDPGTQSYAAPTHNTWDKQTVAHNTVVVDEKTQAEATGKLLWESRGELYAAASADAGPAYANARLQRAMLVTPEYALDIVQADGNGVRQFDWVYHNAGAVSTPLALAPFNGFPQSDGYQHLTGNRAADPEKAWQMTFDTTPNQATYGVLFRSTANVTGSWQYSTEQAYSGRLSSRVAYRFTGPGYLLYTTPTLTNLPDEVPQKLSMQVYGDGSGHRLVLRINDATDERFVATVGAINWHGWRKVELTGLERWQHYLGNDDGVIDTPVKSVSIELQQTSGSPAEGAFFVDDIGLEFASGTVMVSDFDSGARRLRVWMLGAPATTVVTGNGLGPDLLVPVPYVMARRKAEASTFVTLLEPFADEPRVLSFEQSAPGVYVVKGAGFADTIRISTENFGGFERVVP